jgi:putative holliday junction resolvase
VSRLLGIDLGERRIGLALAEEGFQPPRPLATIRRGRTASDDAAALVRLAMQHAADELIVGLPLDASGAAGSQAELTRQWGLAIAERIDLPVRFRDERLSSYTAEQRLGPMKRGRSGGPPTPAQREAYRARVDREAAAIILEAELEARAGAPDEARGTSRAQPKTDHARRGDMESSR